MPRCALYRHFAADGTLLYVGATANPVARTAHHRTAPWFGDVVSIRVQWFASREEAEAAETAAVLAEKPVHNRRASPRSPRGPYRVRGQVASPLALWLKAEGLTQTQAANRLHVSQSVISRLRRGLLRPSIRSAVLIEQATNGAVPVSSWDAA